MESPSQFPDSTKTDSSVSKIGNRQFVVLTLLSSFVILLSIGYYLLSSDVANNSSVTLNDQKIDRAVFQNKYGINHEIESNTRLIYFRNFYNPYPKNVRQLIVSDIAGNNLRVIKDEIVSPSNTIERFPSPQGTYYVLYDLVTKKNTVIRTINESAVFVIPNRVHIPKWSPDERYIADTMEIYEYNAPTKDFVVIYDLKTKKEIFRMDVGPLRKPGGEIVDGVFRANAKYTKPKIVWSDHDNSFYTYNDNGIIKISNLQSNPSAETFPTSTPCNGIAVDDKWIFCHDSLSTIWPSVANPALSSITGGIHKYALPLDRYPLGEPERVTLVNLEGEYHADVFSIDENYLLFVPLLGYYSIVEKNTGRIAELSAPVLTRTARDYQIETAAFDMAIDSANREETVPIIYRGK